MTIESALLECKLDDSVPTVMRLHRINEETAQMVLRVKRKLVQTRVLSDEDAANSHKSSELVTDPHTMHEPAADSTQAGESVKDELVQIRTTVDSLVSTVEWLTREIRLLNGDATSEYFSGDGQINFEDD